MNTIEIRPLPPFRLESSVRALQRLPTNRVDVWDDGRYLRVLPIAGAPRLIVAEDLGTIERPLVRVAVLGDERCDAEAESVKEIVSTIIGAEVDVEPFYHLALQEPHLRDTVAALRGLKPVRFPTIFEVILNSVIFQQISLAAATAIAGRLAERFGQCVAIGGRKFLGPAEPLAIANASATDLRTLGLSLRKAEVLRNLAGRSLEGGLSFDRLRTLSTPEAIQELTALPGIGRWTAEVILLRGLGRLDAFPVGDVGVRKGLGHVLGMERPLTPTEEQRLLEKFGDVRGCLYFYTLGWRLLKMGVIQC